MKVSKPIKYDGVNNINISGLSITAGSGPAISISNAINVRITMCRLLNGTTLDSVGIYLYKCTNVSIDFCYFSNVSSGIVASTSTRLYIADNQFLNMLGPKPRGQFVQLIECYGPGNSIIKNLGENILGQSIPEDAINIYNSNGTADSPIRVAWNKIRGGGPSPTGGGIILGDQGGSYQTALENTLVNPGQYGIAVAGGSNMSLKGNLVYGSKQPFTNVGVVAMDWYNSNSKNIEISGNRVNYTSSLGFQNPIWNGGNMGPITGLDTNKWGDMTLSPSILPTQLITLK